MVAQPIFLEVHTEILCSAQCLLPSPCLASARIQHQAKQCDNFDDGVEFRQLFVVPLLLDTRIYFSASLFRRKMGRILVTFTLTALIQGTIDRNARSRVFSFKTLICKFENTWA
jgi:hypothetical protein